MFVYDCVYMLLFHYIWLFSSFKYISLKQMFIDIFCFLDIDTSMSVWEGIVVTPSEKAYEKPADKDEEEEDGVDKESDDQMETQEQ